MSKVYMKPSATVVEVRADSLCDDAGLGVGSDGEEWYGKKQIFDEFEEDNEETSSKVWSD